MSHEKEGLLLGMAQGSGTSGGIQIKTLLQANRLLPRSFPSPPPALCQGKYGDGKR